MLLHSLPQWEPLTGCISQEVTARPHLEPEPSCCFIPCLSHAKVLLWSKQSLRQAIRKSLQHPYNKWTSTAKIIIIWRHNPEHPAESFWYEDGFLPPSLVLIAIGFFLKKLAFGFHLKNGSEVSHTRSLSCRLLEEIWSVSITSGSSRECDKEIQSKYLVHFFSPQNFNLASV